MTSIKRRSRLDLNELSYEAKAQEILDQANYQEDDQFKQILERTRLYFLGEPSLKKLLAETTLEPRKRPEFEKNVSSYLSSNNLIVPGMNQSQVANKIWAELCSTGPLHKALEDNNINEIQLDGWNQPWVIHRDKGKIQAQDIIKFSDKADYERILKTKILNACGKSVSNKEPIVDARVGNNRVSIIWEPISQQNGPSVVIRKFPPMVLTQEEFLKAGTATKEMFDLLRLATITDLSLAVAGATGSGKTTLFKMLASYIPKGQRTFVIEDTAEMKLHELYPYSAGYQFVSHEARITGDSESDVMPDHILIAAMRQTPERIIFGEIRRALDLLSGVEFANTGHPFWFTGHGEDDIKYTTRMIMMLTRADPSLSTDNANLLLSESLNLIIIQEKFDDGKRRISQITELDGIKDGRVNLRPLYKYDTESNQFIKLNPVSDKIIAKFKHKRIPKEEYQVYMEKGEKICP